MKTAPTLPTNKLVIGYCLEALEYSKSSGAMLLINGATKPHKYESYQNFNRWNLLSFELGIAGLTPIPSRIESIRIEDGAVHVITEFYKKIIICFEELYIFDMELVEGVEAEEEVLEYIVYDWFDIKCGAKQTLDRIEGATNFVNELVFYPSERRDGNAGHIKDCYSKSYILGEDLNKFENSETSARLASLALLKSRDIKGPTRQVEGKVHYLNVVLEHRDREIHKKKKEYVVNKELSSNIFWCNILT